MDRKVLSTCKLTTSQYVLLLVFENFLDLDSVEAFNSIIRILLKTFSYQGLFLPGQKQILSVNPSCLYFELTRNIPVQTFK